MNINRRSRLLYAELLRHFAAGRLTNHEYEDAADKLLVSRDASLWAIYLIVWLHYDDWQTHRLTGKWKLSPDMLRNFARIIVFLHSGLPYKWPRTPLWRMLLGIVTRLFPSRPCGGDESVWPFFRREDFEAAIARPRLLGGAD